jgi:isopenicillin-N epimerase
MPTAPGSLRSHWSLDPGIVFLNHGSFGACPSAVLAVQQAYRDQLEREPARFFTREAPPLLAAAREALGAFLGAPSDGLGLVANVSTAINAVLRSMALPAGSEILITDHAYNATRNVVEYVAQERGCRVVLAKVPFPLESEAIVLERILGAVTSRTRLAVIDHVTSQTALVFPVEALIRELDARSVDVLVDGAHAPGMLDLDVGALAPAYYTGNCHKWMCAPKSVGFVWAREDKRTDVRPTVISHGANAPVPREERFRMEFDWLGTTDPSAALSLPSAIDTLAGLVPGGWPEVRRRNRVLARAGRSRLLEVFGGEPPAPEGMLGSMASVPVPAGAPFPARQTLSALDRDPLHEALFLDHAIEVPILSCPAHPGRMLRISAQLYNEPADYEALAFALERILSPGRSIG